MLLISNLAKHAIKRKCERLGESSILENESIVNCIVLKLVLTLEFQDMKSYHLTEPDNSGRNYKSYLLWMVIVFFWTWLSSDYFISMYCS